MTITAEPPKPVREIIADLKEHGEDFEFYPTTEAMIQTILEHLKSDAFYEQLGSYRYRNFDTKTILDVGAGTGAFLKAAGAKFQSADLLAIEKSQILVGQLVSFCKVIGTDFHAQSFLPKQVDILFTNPPYLEYAAWTSRLIKECPAAVMYLIIPQRWKDDEQIKAAIEFRHAEVSIIGSDDFLTADRRSRAKVDILCVTPKEAHDEDDLFTRFFMEKFGHLRDKMKESADKAAKQQAEHKQSLVERQGLIGALVELYNAEMERLRTNYEKAASLDATLLMELGLSINSIINTLHTKLDTLKAKYWEELFSNLDTVTNRLTSKNRRKLLDTIGGFKAVDFSGENIYAVILWIMEHANKYIDEQILEVFDRMLSKANMRNYKSNQKVYGEGRYRYEQEQPTHVSLDYRIVLDGGYGIRVGWNKEHSLGDYGKDFVADLLCVATLLKFPSCADHTEWSAGKPKLFTGFDGEDVAEFKAFKNGNMHVRMAQRLVLALNVAVGKLRGWIRNQREAADELGAEAAEHFALDLHIGPKQLLLGAPQGTP